MSKEDAAIEKLKRSAAGAPGTPTQQQPKSDAVSTKETLTRAIQMSEASNETGQQVMTSLGKQRETIQHSINRIDETQEDLRFGRRALKEMKHHICREKVIKALVIVVLLFVIWLIIYVKWGWHSNSK